MLKTSAPLGRMRQALNAPNQVNLLNRLRRSQPRAIQPPQVPRTTSAPLSTLPRQPNPYPALNQRLKQASRDDSEVDRLRRKVNLYERGVLPAGGALLALAGGSALASRAKLKRMAQQVSPKGKPAPPVATPRKKTWLERQRDRTIEPD